MAQGFLPKRDALYWLAARRTDVAPDTLPWNLVVHTSFLPRGLSLPLNSFARGILTYYGLQLHHLTPNGVLHLACYITLCECFLGMAPHFGLWRYFFEVLPRRENGRIPDCGGATIQPRPGSGYFELPTPQLKEAWQEDWFYAPNLPRNYNDTGLPIFSHKPLQERSEWRSVTELSSETAALVEAVHQLQDGGLSGMQILTTWMERNVRPLGWRRFPMYDYNGLKDPSRLHNREVTPSELKLQMHLVTGVTMDEIFLEVAIEPYHRGNPLVR